MSTFSTATPGTAAAPLLVSQREAAVALCVCERTVFDLAARGELQRVRLPGCSRVLFDRADLLALIARAKAPPTAPGTTTATDTTTPTPTTHHERPIQ
ncbi:MAG: hypothetical protein ACKVS8_10715 [Phycisphaerales bacterium]